MAEKWLVGGSGQEAGHGRTSMMPRTSGRIQPRQLIAALAFLTVATMLTGCGETPAPAPAPVTPAVVVIPAPTPTPTPEPTETMPATVPAICVTTEVDGIATNGGFESGSQGWTSGGDTHFLPTTAKPSPAVPGAAAKGGTGFAQLGGPTSSPFEATRGAWLTAPNVVLPTASKVWVNPSISFDARIISAETDGDGHDQLTVFVSDQSGAYPVQAVSNLSATPGYAHYSFDVTRFLGESVAVSFILMQDDANPTTVLLDNVQVSSLVAPPAIAGPGTGKEGVNLTTLMNSGRFLSQDAIASTDGPTEDVAQLGRNLAMNDDLPGTGIIAQMISIGVLGCAKMVYESIKPDGRQWSESTTYAGVDVKELLKSVVAWVSEGKSEAVEPRMRYVAEFNSPEKPASVETDTNTLLAGVATAQQQIGIPYYYPNTGGFAADMTASQAAQLYSDEQYARNTLSSLVSDQKETLNDESWPSPIGTPGNGGQAIHVFAPGPNNGLTHLTSRSWSNASIYTPLNLGANVDAYVVDTGLNPWAVDAETGALLFASVMNYGRVTHVRDAYSVPMFMLKPIAASNPFETGFSIAQSAFVWDPDLTPEQATTTQRLQKMSDEDGHGTQVAAALGGASGVGVSPGANLIPIKVMDRNNPPTESSVTAGVEWALTREEQKAVDARNAVPAVRALPAVLNDSLNASSRPLSFTAEEEALINMSSYGAVTLAAGNVDADACNYAPGEMAQTATGIITVGSVAQHNDRFGVFGDCVTMFAPGYMNDVAGPNILYGSSIASAMTAGTAAQLESLTGGLSGADVRQLLVARATTGIISDINNTDPVLNNTHAYVEPGDTVTLYQHVFQGQGALSNKLLYIGSQCSNTYSPELLQGNANSLAQEGEILDIVPGIDSATAPDPACPSAGSPMQHRTVRFSVSFPYGPSPQLLAIDPSGRPTATVKIDLMNSSEQSVYTEILSHVAAPTGDGSIRVVYPLPTIALVPTPPGAWWRITVSSQDRTVVAISRFSITGTWMGN